MCLDGAAGPATHDVAITPFTTNSRTPQSQQERPVEAVGKSLTAVSHSSMGGSGSPAAGLGDVSTRFFIVSNFRREPHRRPGAVELESYQDTVVAGHGKRKKLD